MIRSYLGGLQLWQFENLGSARGVSHFVSDRQSLGESFTLSLSSTPDKEAVIANRLAVANAFGIPEARLIFPSQVHLTRSVVVTEHTVKDDLMGTDALITATPGFCICVMSADCVPVLLFDKRNRVIAAVHAGWRGTVAGIVDKTLARMADEFNTKGGDIVAGIGPSVCHESYEVGEEVINAVRENLSHSDKLLMPQPNGKAKLDLWKANRLQLIDFGVPESQVEISDLCTVKNNQYFFSARKGDAGRFAAGIMLK